MPIFLNAPISPSRGARQPSHHAKRSVENVTEATPALPRIEAFTDVNDAELTLTLSYDARTRTRARVTLDDGSEAGLFLPRGRTLRDGDRLAHPDGRTIRICAAVEPVTRAATEDPLLLARAAYHLGNRHAPLQIGPGWLRYQRDHVLDEMVRGLGLTPVAEEAPFEPESGAYGGHHHH